MSKKCYPFKYTIRIGLLGQSSEGKFPFLLFSFVFETVGIKRVPTMLFKPIFQFKDEFSNTFFSYQCNSFEFHCIRDKNFFCVIFTKNKQKKS